MSENHNPPLTPEIYEQIKIDQHKVHKDFWVELRLLRVNSVERVLTLLGVAEPEPPRQPFKLSGILKRYAVELFICEYKHYPFVAELIMWRNILASKIEELVMENITKIERGVNSLAFHASHAEMREAVVEGLSSYVKTLLEPIILVTEGEIDPDPRPPESGNSLKALIEESGMTKEEVANEVKLDVRSVYRHLAGGKIRNNHREAYERFLSQKLNRHVTLETSC